jgi:hypothetical protein
LLTATVAVSLVACGSKTGGDAGAPNTAGAADTQSESAPVDTPSAEPTGPETPRPKGSGDVAISVPSLPVGGGSTNVSESDQCVTASWLNPTIPDGVAVQVTKVVPDPDGVFDLGGGCDSIPGCRPSFVYTSTQSSCSIAVTAKKRQGRETKLSLKGEIRCPAGNRTCADFAHNAKGTSQLAPITQPRESSGSAEESPPSSTTG